MLHPMAYHLTHSDHYILYEPEAEFLQPEDLDDLINEVLTEFSETVHLILYTGSLDFLLDEDLDQLRFLNEELTAKGGFLLVVSRSEQLTGQLGEHFQMAGEIEEAIDLIEDIWLDRELDM